MWHLLKLSAPAIAVSLLIAACGSSSGGSTTSSSANEQSSAQTSSAASSAVVRTVSNATFGTILVDGKGMTLYHLSGEQNGKFICTGSGCLGVWHPVLKPTGGTPGGVASLGTVKRPDGSLQVAYKGAPLYTFAQDQQPGETKGEGIKDVGTWSVVTIGSARAAGTSNAPATSTSSTSAAPAPAGRGGYGY